MSRRSESAWADFWSGGGAGPEGGCLPEALRGIDAAQRRLWEEVAAPLARRARVLDLATGDGAVLARIGASRSDLKLIGVDSSPVLPPGPRKAQLIAGVAMEALPFPDDSFDLVTSQFGLEYGDTSRIAGEVGRVLRPGGRFAFVVHHCGSAIVAHNRERAEALRWAALDSGLLDKATALANGRKLVALPTPAAFHQAPAEARRRFPRQSVGQEFATAVLQTLEMGQRRPPSETLEVLATLRSKAENEIARIDALRTAARDERQIANLHNELLSAGLTSLAPETLCEEQSGRSLAWLIRGLESDAAA